MKKRFAVALALMLLLSLATHAWATSAPDATPDVGAQTEDVDEWLFAEDEDFDNWGQDEEYDPSIFDDISGDGYETMDEEDLVEDTLLSAMEVYSWFVLQPLDVDPDKPDSTGTRFQVLDERFNTMTALRDFVSTYFSDELVEELFAMNVYTEENGYLYTTTDGRNIDENVAETEFEVTEETADEIVYTVTVHYWGEEDDTEEQFTYVRKLIGGTWKFTEFPFYW